MQNWNIPARKYPKDIRLTMENFTWHLDLNGRSIPGGGYVRVCTVRNPVKIIYAPKVAKNNDIGRVTCKKYIRLISDNRTDALLLVISAILFSAISISVNPEAIHTTRKAKKTNRAFELPST